MVDLSGTKAVVTGAGRGIGKAIALALSEAGASVSLLARTEGEIAEGAEEIRRRGGDATAIVCDVSSRQEIADAFARAEAEHGPTDLLVNNAAIFGPLEPFSDSDPDAWWRAQEVNVFGPALCCRSVLPSMIARRRGRIINIVSGAISVAYFSSYITSKSALIRFSECLALEVKPHDIAVFPMGPGTVRTKMSEASVNSAAGKKWIPWFQNIFDQGLDLPLERPAALAVALASGKYDALSGLNVWPFDDLDWMLAHREEIEREKLFTMKIEVPETDEVKRLIAIREKGRKV